MSWIESHQSLARHRKTLRAAGLLHCDRHKLIGHLHSLWWWALDNVGTDGSLGCLTDAEIAEAAEWPVRRAREFVKALGDCGAPGPGFIVGENGSRQLHDWYEYAGKLIQRRAQDRERKRKPAESPQSSDGIPAEVQGNSTTTVPYPTVPYQTLEQNKGITGEEEAPRASPRKRRPPPAIDEEFLERLRQEPGFQGININLELVAFQDWCQRKRKDPTRARFINWVKKAREIPSIKRRNFFDAASANRDPKEYLQGKYGHLIKH